VTGYDVVVLGEALVELLSSEPLRSTRHLDLSFSGDALNAAAAAAAAGASVALVTRVGDDEFGEQLIACANQVGIDTRRVLRASRPNGVYFVGADPAGTEEFVYLRGGSAATTFTPEDLPDDILRSSRSLLTSGIACAISPGMRAAVERAVEIVGNAGGLVIYDPNFRRKLTTAAEARAIFEAIAPRADVVVPSCPTDTLALFDTDDPQVAAAACRATGARAAAVTLGAEGVLVAADDETEHISGLPAPALVDATGSGDVFAGTLAARLALGEELRNAARGATAAASLSLAGRGGLGSLSRWEDVQAHATASGQARAAADTEENAQ
jgi:2-dehydro-3-deoxygluconokinase